MIDTNKTEGRGQRAEGRGQRAEGRGQRAEGRGQRAEGKGQRAEGRVGHCQWLTSILPCFALRAAQFWPLLSDLWPLNLG